VGSKIIRGLNPDQICVAVQAFSNEFALPHERPVLIMDRTGDVGSKTYRALRDLCDTAAPPFELFGLQMSAKAPSARYGTMRDELVSMFQKALADGVGILENDHVDQELHLYEWRETDRGLLKATDKNTFRSELGRSPDESDALMMAFFEPSMLRDEDAPPEATRPVPQSPQIRRDEDDGDAYDGQGLDPYAGSSAFRR
jgi:hypothetical protein